MPRLDQKTRCVVFWSDMKTCFLFPGQGAQYPGMAKDLWERSAKVKELFEVASRAAAMDTRKLLFESTAEELKVTDKTQVAITLASLCSSAYLKERGASAQGYAGFSLGEYAALCEAGVIAVNDVFPIVKARGDIMEAAARELDATGGPPGMAAVVGMPAEKVAEIVNGLAGAGVHVANHNSPVQVVIAGTGAGLAAAEAALKAAGARRLIRLAVSGPFHSPLMAKARAAFDKALAAYAFADPRLPVYSNVTGRRITTGAEARTLCGEQLVSSVKWVTVEECLLADGFDLFLEAGPGTVLAGLLKARAPEAACRPAGTAEAIDKALAEGT
jgi:[acyl-carrier-protein] S-malonyltransferase